MSAPARPPRSLRRDLAIGLQRRQQLDDGTRLTDSLARLGRRLATRGLVLPMSDDPVRTRVTVDGRTLDLQRFLIEARGEGTIEQIDFDGAAAASPSPEVLAAIATARAIVIGPSNPLLSIGPILALPGVRDALAAAAAPVVAVSPVVGGRIIKGPTASCLRWAGHPADVSGIIRHYGALLDGVVTDSAAADPPIPQLVIDTLRDTPDSRRDVAGSVLAFATEDLAA